MGNEGHGHMVTIVVNGQQRTVEKEALTFDEVVALAFDPVPTGENVHVHDHFQARERREARRHLTEGETVKVKEGMIFDVTATDKS
jgi:predicted metal-dependent TIM-barrel fold hydrolase